MDTRIKTFMMAHFHLINSKRKICLNWLFMLLVMLLVITRLLVGKFLRSQMWYTDFLYPFPSVQWPSVLCHGKSEAHSGVHYWFPTVWVLSPSLCSHMPQRADWPSPHTHTVVWPLMGSLLLTALFWPKLAKCCRMVQKSWWFEHIQLGEG